MGRQELEVRLGKEHISFETAKIGSLVDVQDSEDPEGLRVMYYLVQDLKVGREWGFAEVIHLTDNACSPTCSALCNRFSVSISGSSPSGEELVDPVCCFVLVFRFIKSFFAM